MPTTYKRVHIYLSKYESKILEELQKELGDTQSRIFKIALLAYYDMLKNEKK